MNKRRLITLLARAVLIAMILPAVSMTAHAELKVYPRLITPGSPPENENVFFVFNEANDPKPRLRILNINGEKVADVSTLSPRATADGWRLAWDGRDESGNIVLPGVYVFQWEEAGKVQNGTIVVAR